MICNNSGWEGTISETEKPTSITTSEVCGGVHIMLAVRLSQHLALARRETFLWFARGSARARRLAADEWCWCFFSCFAGSRERRRSGAPRNNCERYSVDEVRQAFAEEEKIRWDGTACRSQDDRGEISMQGRL